MGNAFEGTFKCLPSPSGTDDSGDDTDGFIFTPYFWRKLNGFEYSFLFMKFKRGGGGRALIIIIPQQGSWLASDY